jgi:hypothetical protein
MHFPRQNAWINAQLKHKREATQKFLKAKDFSSYIFMHERAYRLNAFLDVQNEMSNKEYWELLASIWTDSENIWQNLPIWKKLFKSKRPDRKYLMDEEEQNIYNSLPDVVTAHRGHQGKNKNGLSYTLDKDKAKWFANRWKQRGKVDTIQIPKSKIIAYFSVRNESEIIVI